MRIAMDVTHPSHAMMYAGIRAALERRDHFVLIASRAKDVTVELLDGMGLDHHVASKASGRGRAGEAIELLSRVWMLMRLIRRHRIDLVLARSPAGCIAARLTGRRAIFDTDDGTGAGIHHRLAAPFAHVITSPASLGEDLGPRHVTYPSIKSLGYLHPTRFAPAGDVRERLGVPEGTPVFVLRRSAWSASHDHGRSGLHAELSLRIAELLTTHGHLVVSSEDEAEGMLSTSPFLRAQPDSLAHVLAAASLVVTDGASVAEEAAILGTHAVWISDFVGERGYLNMLCDEYRAITMFRPNDADRAIAWIESAVRDVNGTRKRAEEVREAILADHVDLVEWYADFVHTSELA
jgi:uncharacterized protein